MSYGLYLAKVVNIAASDNRLQVQVLPHMQSFEKSSCPVWPCFFKDELLLALKDDMVWVICDDEFSNGYVLGLANYNTYRDEMFAIGSIPQSLKDSLNETLVSLKAEKFEFLDLKVEFWNKDTIHFIERSSGGKIIAFSNGTLYILRPQELLIKIKDTLIKVDEDGVSIKGAAIQLQSDDVALGNNPIRNVLTTFGVRGDVVEPSESVKA